MYSIFCCKGLTAAVLLNFNTAVYYVLLLEGIGLKERNLDSTIVFDLNQQLAEIDAEKAFLKNGCKKAKETYEAKRKQHHVGEQSLFALAWEVDGFDKLIKVQDDVVAMIHSIKEMMQMASPRRANLPRQLSELRKQLEEYRKHRRISCTRR